MITLRPSAERGHADHGWLDARHSFSFADYVDPRWMGFGPLRVLNQDRIAPGTGFGLHGHRDMEIVTWVLDGALRHEDSLGHGAELRPGTVQLMSAGSGIRHSEANASDSEPLELLQMWVLPARQGTPPSYAEQDIPEQDLAGRLALLASPDEGDGSLTIGQDVRVHAARLRPGDVIDHTLVGRNAWLHLARGAAELSVRGDGGSASASLSAGDGAGLSDVTGLTLTAREAGELVLFDLP